MTALIILSSVAGALVSTAAVLWVATLSAKHGGR